MLRRTLGGATYRRCVRPAVHSLSAILQPRRCLFSADGLQLAVSDPESLSVEQVGRGLKALISTSRDQLNARALWPTYRLLAAYPRWLLPMVGAEVLTLGALDKKGIALALSSNASSFRVFEMLNNQVKPLPVSGAAVMMESALGNGVFKREGDITQLSTSLC